MPEQTIQIVDDVPENISTLYAFLSKQGFKVLVAPDGESALELAVLNPPDLILLDVMMPGIDGFETCASLKGNQATRDIPVIFMTALSDTVDKVKGFSLGAVDYVTKPIQQEEVLSRIRAHLTIRDLRRELESRNAELEAKNQELRLMNEDLDAFSRAVAHDLRSPLGVIKGSASLVRQFVDQGATEKVGQFVDYISVTSDRMLDTIEGLMTLAGVAHRTPSIAPLHLERMIDGVLVMLKEKIAASGAEVKVAQGWPPISGDRRLVEVVLANYLGNAIKYGGVPPRIEVGHDGRNGKLRLWVRDNGPGLSPEEQAKLFTPFTRLRKVDAEGYGVGLSIVERVAARLGEEAGVESAPGQGCLFYFTLTADGPGRPAKPFTSGSS
jgi:two-component system, sensor histidine kinase and response regulator